MTISETLYDYKFVQHTYSIQALLQETNISVYSIHSRISHHILVIT